MTDTGNTLLSSLFTQFYQKLLQVKANVANPGWAGLNGDNEANGPATVSRYLVGLLRRSFWQAEHQAGPDGRQDFRQAQFALAALADDVMLSLDWPGRASWTQNLVETAIFGTSMAGEQIFRDIEALLKRRDAAQQDLAYVYFMTLSLGFQGQYRGQIQTEALVATRKQLHQFIWHRDPSLDLQGKHLVPEAYLYTVHNTPPKQLPQIAKWTIGLVLLIVGFIVLQHVLWKSIQTPLDPILAEILANPTVHDAPASPKPTKVKP